MYNLLFQYVIDILFMSDYWLVQRYHFKYDHSIKSYLEVHSYQMIINALEWACLWWYITTIYILSVMNSIQLWRYTIQFSTVWNKQENHKQYYKLHNIQSLHTCKQFQHFNIHRCARISSLYLLNWEKISTGILLLKHNASHQYLGIGLK